MAASVRQTVRTLAVTLFLSAALWAALISVAAAETIQLLHADIAVQADSSFIVTETIVYDFEGASRHGIYRNIRNTHPQPASAWYKERRTEITLLSVSREGRSETHQVEPYDGLSVRIGHPDHYVTGVQTYEIQYKVEGGLAEYSDGVELYWNVTGDEWQVNMGEVVVNVYDTPGVALRTANDCYVGRAGSIKKCTAAGIGVFTEQGVAAGEQLTIAQGLTLPGPVTVIENVDAMLLWLLGLAAWFSVLGVWLYRWRTTHRTWRAVVAQYEPFETFKPMFTGVLFDNRLDPRDLTASIVYLAQQGFIKITRTTDKVLWIFETTDYELTLLRPDSEAETGLQKQVLAMLFQNASVSGKTMKLSDITKSNSRQRTNYKLLQEMKKAAVKDLVAQGFLEQRISRGVKGAVLAMGLYFGFLIFEPLFDLFARDLIVSFFALLVTTVLFFLVGTERRTRRGYEALNHLKGFKDFLATTETERYKFHNAPSKSPEQFMEYLPYAIAFGVEKEWADVFKDIAIDTPEWYSSPSGAHFSAAAFTSDIGSFATAFASSGASGSSGSSGGGFSGGGGGGGGGGSW